MKTLKRCCLYIAFTITFSPIYAYAGWTPPVRISDEALAHDPRMVTNVDTLHVVYWRGGRLHPLITCVPLTGGTPGANHFI